VYIKHILSQLINDLKSRGLTLCHDKDLSHDSKGTKAWVQKNGLPMITLSGVSPDFSIFKSMASTLKRRFYYRRITTKKAALARFCKIFKEELDEEEVESQYKWYTKRLHECGRRDGQMTRY
jgi:hypothetical protein